MTRRTFATLVFAVANLPLISTVGAQAVMLAPAVSPDQSVAQATVMPPGPPAGFNAAIASDTQLAAYGFPPRPPVGSANYSAWLRLVSPSIRRVSATLQQTILFNGTAQNLSKMNSSVSNGTSTSSNWSGYAQTGAAGTFSHNNDYVFSEWVVPKAQQAFGTCDGTWWYSSQWVGFDGFGSADVLQAGTEADALCLGGTTYTFYSAWYEWYPFSEVRVSLPVSGGDLMGGEVWYTTTAPFGHAYIVDYTNQHSISVAFNPPAGTTYQGNSVEWVEERPGINGGLANLTNYVADQFNLAYAYAGGQYYEPVYGPGTTQWAISMICPPWNPGSSCTSTTTLSTPYLYGYYTLWFYNSG